MSFFRRRRVFVEDPDFGAITRGKGESWEGDRFCVWGCLSVQVMINAGSDGPSKEQREFVRLLRADHQEIRERIERVVAAHALPRKGTLAVSSIFLPQCPTRQVWKVWFDMEGDDQFWYGAEIQGWDRIVPFAED